jgi:hypothetical protein
MSPGGALLHGLLDVSSYYNPLSPALIDRCPLPATYSAAQCHQLFKDNCHILAIADHNPPLAPISNVNG